MLGIAEVGEDGSMDRGMQRLDPAAQHLCGARNRFDRRDTETTGAQCVCGTARSDELNSVGDQPGPKIEKP